jgi:tyrosinase
MNKHPFTRRRLLQQTGTVGGALLLDRAIFGNGIGIAPVLAQPVVQVRKDIDTLTPAEIQALRTGISVMKSRPTSAPTSWIFQANMHGHPAGTGAHPAWDKCQHGSFFFLSWHRMYIYFFERILRAASGNPNLTLPYWNYSKATPTARALPAPFRTPTTGNPLFVAQRNPPINTGALLPSSAVSTTVALATINFTGPTGSSTNFGGQTVTAPMHFTSPHGQLESQPHDVVHVQVGGSTGWMSDPNLAARDPIFWLHHANIDRLWNQWLSTGGGRVNPVTSAAWTTPNFTFFTETGASVSMSACQILISATQLGYRYDTDGAPVGGSCPTPLAAANMASMNSTSQKAVATKQGRVVLGDQPVTVSVELGTEAKTALTAAAGGQTYLLSIEGISYSKQPGVHYEVYLNLPAGLREPDPEGIHYVGNLSFFALRPAEGRGSHAAHADVKQTFDITEVVRNLRAKNLWNEDRLSVTFVARGLNNPDGTRQKPTVTAKPQFTRLSVVVE